MLSVLLLTVALSTPSSLQHGSPPVDRANHGMGFDQAATTHHFVLERTGGTIEVTARPGADSATAERVRMHLRHIATAFATGDFSLPMFIHDADPPGTQVVKERREQMTFRFEALSNGGRVMVRTADREALAALHAFLRFQIREHKTGDPMEPK